jgi:hypothetical protein
MVRRAARTALFCAVLAAVVEAGCQLIVDRAGVQCTSTEECRSRGGAFEQTRCSNAGVCESIVVPDAQALTGHACATTADCRLFDDEDGGGSGPVRCIANQCAPVLPPSVAGASPPCVFLGPIEADNAVLAVALMPLYTGAAALEFSHALDVLGAVVVRGWNDAVQGTAASPVAFVVCDEAQLGATDHAIENHVLKLQPSFVIGPYTTGRTLGWTDYLDTLRLAKTAVPLTFSPSFDAVSAAGSPPPDGLLSCSPNAAGALPALVDAVGRLSLLVAGDGSPRSKPPKVQFVRTTGDDQDQLMRELTALLPADAGAPNVTAVPNFDPETKSLVLVSAQEVVTAKPDVIVIVSELLASDFVTGVEQRWTLNAPYPRPVYLVLRTPSALEESISAYSPRYFAVDWWEPAAASNFTSFAADLAIHTASQAAGQGAPPPPNATLSLALTNDCTLTALFSLFAASHRNATSMTAVSPSSLELAAQALSADSTNTLVNLIGSGLSAGVSLETADQEKDQRKPLPVRLLGTRMTMSFQDGFLDPQNDAGAALFCISREKSWTFTKNLGTGTGNDVGTACP